MEEVGGARLWTRDGEDSAAGRAGVRSSVRLASSCRHNLQAFQADMQSLQSQTIPDAIDSM